MSLAVAVGSQTPFIRLKRPWSDIAPTLAERPTLKLGDLTRGRDYSATPGGVARMVHAFLRQAFGLGRISRAFWATLDLGLPDDLHAGPIVMRGVPLAPSARASYGEAKEKFWNALNGLPPAAFAPAFVEALEAWSRANAKALTEAHEEDPFDVFYINDWQHLPQGQFLDGLPRVFHMHAPIDDWTPPGWGSFVRRSLGDYDAVIVSCDRYVQHLERAGLSTPVRRIYPWVDPATFPRAGSEAVAAFAERFGIQGDDEVVLNVGRMDPVKGQDRLIRALPLILEKRPRAKLVLVGNGSFSSSKQGGIGLDKGRRWRSKLEGLVRDLGVEERVVFTGHLTQASVGPALERCDAFAFPSVAEGFGLAVVEAWLYGKPVAVAHGAGVSELVEDGVNGLVVDGGDRESWAKAVLAALEAGPSFAKEARKTAALCDVRRQGPRALKLLEDVASARAPDAEAPRLSQGPSRR